MSLFKDSDVHVLPPKAGFYVFPDFKRYGEKLKSLGITTSHEFCDRLLEETGIAVLPPGKDFRRVPEKLTAQLAYVNFDGNRSLEAAYQIPSELSLDDQFLYSYCKGPVVATGILCGWLKTFRSGDANAP